MSEVWSGHTVVECLLIVCFMRRWTRNARASTLNPLADCIADRWIDYEQSVISLSILEFDDLMDHFNSQFTSGLLRLEWILTVIQEITYILLSKTRFMASQAGP